jgi:hypothetical protein
MLMTHIAASRPSANSSSSGGSDLGTDAGPSRELLAVLPASKGKHARNKAATPKGVQRSHTSAAASFDLTADASTKTKADTGSTQLAVVAAAPAPSILSGNTAGASTAATTGAVTSCTNKATGKGLASS